MSSGDTATTPRRPSPRVAARRAATRAQILDAAWGLAHERGLTGFSLRELAAAVDLRAPSLYDYFAGKDAIYDAMFAAANRDFLAVTLAAVPADQPLDQLPAVRAALIRAVQQFVAFATEDPVRFQLLFQRSIPDWEPSPEAYAPAQAAYAHLRDRFAAFGADDERTLDLWTAMVSGLAHQQVANDPGGQRWYELAGVVVDLFLHHLGTSTATTAVTARKDPG